MTILAAHHLALQRLIHILQTTQDDAEARRAAVAILRIPIPENDTEDAGCRGGAALGFATPGAPGVRGVADAKMGRPSTTVPGCNLGLVSHPEHPDHPLPPIPLSPPAPPPDGFIPSLDILIRRDRPLPPSPAAALRAIAGTTTPRTAFG
jgi:hypothetical protein